MGFCNQTYNIVVLHSVVLWSTQSVGCSCTVCTGVKCWLHDEDWKMWCSWRLWRRLRDSLKAADCTAYFSNIIMHNTSLFFSSKTSQGGHHEMFTLHKIFILTSHLVSYWLSYIFFNEWTKICQWSVIIALIFHCSLNCFKDFEDLKLRLFSD